jgi:SAM-dependent methyltransferase
VTFAEYSQAHRHVLVDELPPLLNDAVQAGIIADIGCGDGQTIWALHRTNRLGETTYAIDLSPERVREAERVSPTVRGIVADATATTLPDSSVDGVIASQVIEHLPDDRLLAPEISRILKPHGWWYIGSVLRSSHAWWFYKDANGQRLLDPTHIREYRSGDAFLSAIAHSELLISEVRITSFRFPLLDLFLRSLSSIGLIQPSAISRFYVAHSRFILGRRLRVRAIGYSMIEACGVRL